MTDHLFPRYHVRPPYGYVNDPNGPILIDGVTHLYFQYRHSVDPAAPVFWGHATTRDLVNWAYHQPAIAPHPTGGDREGCWSGNTIVDAQGDVRAFYSGFISEEPLQRTLSAVSTDGGASFSAPQEAVPAPDEVEGIRRLRDPFVWRDGCEWCMVLGAEAPDDMAMVRLYRSADLLVWNYQGALARMKRTVTHEWDSGVMWECPQVAELNDVSVLLMGAWEPVQGVTKVLSAVVPGMGQGPDLTPADLHLVDHGPNFYAPSVLRESPAGPILWGWAPEARSSEWCEEDGWSGIVTLPRAISLRPDGGIASSPPGALSALRIDPIGRVSMSILDALPAQLEFTVDYVDEASSGCRLRLGFGPQEYLEVSVDTASGIVAIDRSHASADPRAEGGIFTVSGVDELRSPGSTLRGFVDGSILELFLPGGHVMTTRFYPVAPPPWTLELIDPEAATRMTAWSLSGARQDDDGGQPERARTHTVSLPGES